MSLFSDFMSPLGRDSCDLVYYLGIISLIFAVLGLVSGILNLMSNKSKHRTLFLLSQSLYMFLMYYLYRIAYSICSKVL